MRIIVVSDTHRDFSSFEKVINRHPEADYFIHLGDGIKEAELMQELYPDLKILGVRGNCDLPYQCREDWDVAGTLQIDEINIFYTHGHIYSVKLDLQPLIDAAETLHANIALFGHTHMPLVTYKHNIHIVNPGSLGEPRRGERTYGVLDITNKNNIACHINKLN